MEAHKAPGPEGFPRSLFHKYWKLICPSINSFVQAAFLTDKFPKGANATLISLIPKALN